MKRIDAIRELRSDNINIETRITINKTGYGIDELINLYDYLNHDGDTINSVPIDARSVLP